MRFRAGAILARIQSLGTWGQDKVLRRVLGNSSAMFASYAISAVLTIMTARLLGLADFGLLGIVITFVSAVNRLLSFRMADLVVRYMGEYVTRKEMDRGAALVKAAALTEGITSIIAFVVLVLIAPLGALFFGKDTTSAPLFIFYGISILANITTETATGVLQVTNHYRSQATINLIQSILVALLIVGSYLVHGGLFAILAAYLIGKIILGLGPIVVAYYHLNHLFGKGWWRAPFSLLPPFRELTHFALTTNFFGTINLVSRDSEQLWIRLFFGLNYVAYYKVAQAIINMVVLPITPFVSTSYPEINRAIVTRQWRHLRDLLKRVTLIASVWTGAVAAGILLFGRPVLFQTWVVFGHTVSFLGKDFSPFKPSYLPAYPALLVLLIGYGIASILFWNRSLLLALGQPGFPMKVNFWTALAKVILTVLIVPVYGYVAEAAILSSYFVVSISLMVWRGLSVLKQRELEPSPPDVNSPQCLRVSG